MNWFYAKNGAQEGPISTEALRAKIDSGEVAPTDLAWREGLADWMPVSKIPDFTRQDLLQPTDGFEASPSAPASVSPSSPYVAPVQPVSPVSYQAPVQPIQGGGSSGLAITSMVLGILGFLGCCIPHISGILVLLAIIFGHIAISKNNADPARFGGKGMARTGLVMGYLGLLLTIASGVIWFKITTATNSMTPQQRQEYIESYDWVPGASPEMKQQMREARDKQKEEILRQHESQGK